MPDFEKMYFHLAGKIADAIGTLDKVSRDLKVAQIEGEDMFIGDEAPNETKPNEDINA